MTDEEMVACYADADICVFAENYEAVSFPFFLAKQYPVTPLELKRRFWGQSTYLKIVSGDFGSSNIHTRVKERCYIPAIIRVDILNDLRPRGNFQN